MRNKFEKPVAISVVIPALDEQDTVATVVSAALSCPLIDEVVVVDNGSTDNTTLVARAAGARVVDEPVAGQGNALRTGYTVAHNDWIIKLDADLSEFSPTLVETLHGAVRPGVGLVKGLWFDANDNMPMTRLMVRPAIAIMFPGLSHIRAVNSGLFLFDRSRIAVSELTDGYGADLDVMLRMHTAGWNTVEVDVGQITHNTRNLQHYNKMSETLLRFLIDRHEQAAQNPLFVVTDTAEDIITGSLGLIAKKLKSGSRVTAFLGQDCGHGVDILREVLTDYPAFSIEPISAVDDFNVLSSRHKATIITSCFSHVADADDPVVSAALRLQGKYNKTGRHGILLMMPIRENNRFAVEFRPDVRVDIGQVVMIKKRAQDALCEDSEVAREWINESGAARLLWNGQFNPEATESFQAFDHKDISPPFVTL